MENNPSSNAMNLKLCDALAKCQGQIEAAEKSQKNEAFKKDGKASKYADIADVLEAIKKPCAENGLSTSFNYKTEISDQGRVRNFIQYKLRHSSGEHEIGDWVLMLSRDESQHGWGGANTYYRRQLLKGIFQIPEEDDDGNSGSSAPAPKPPQQKAPAKPPAPKPPQNAAPGAPPRENPPMSQLDILYATIDDYGLTNEQAKDAIVKAVGKVTASKDLTPEQIDAVLKYLKLTKSSNPEG